MILHDLLLDLFAALYGVLHPAQCVHTVELLGIRAIPTARKSLALIRGQ